MSQKLLIIFFSLMFFVSDLPSQTISIPDTTAQRGIYHKIPVYLEFDHNYSSLEIRIDYNALLLDIVNVHGGENMVIVDDNAFFEKNQADLEKSYIIIKPINIDNNFTKLCEIEYESLAGPDSVAYFDPTKLIVDGEEVTLEAKQGKISIGDPIFPIQKNTISHNYPNPFNYQTNFDFYLADQSIVEFTIFTGNGKKAYTFPGDDFADFKIINKDSGELTEFDENNSLPEGNYTLTLTIERWKWSSRIYYVNAKLGNSIHSRKFIILK